ncbi:FemAB family PEP-CTERM system-associated protein [soil metagenome]
MPLSHPVLGVRAADLRDADERARIDSFVRGAAGATPFHLTGWSRAVVKGCGQKAHYLIAEHGDGAIVGVLPLTEMRSKLFGQALVSAGFAVDGGVLGEGLEPLSSAAWTLAGELDCPTMELRGGAAPADWAINDTSYIGFVRDLAGDDEAELLAIPRKQRAEVRKGLANNLPVEIGRDLKAHYAVYSESVRNLGTPVFPRALFAAVLAEFGDAADILTVRHEGKPVASVLSLYFNGTVYPYWGGGSAAARALRANDAMYFALMRHARERGCTRFDFGRSKAGTGAAAFKKNWGFEPNPLAYSIRVADGAVQREINPLNPRYKLKIALWKRLPLGVANLVGPVLARGLG